jgi:peptide-methionine (S)-S-oxide reductase
VLFFNAATVADTAIFAGGCFWCMEVDFEKVEGVNSVVSGYTGGDLPEPNYKQVSKGGTDHYEAVSIDYDPEKISYRQLLDIFWKNIDPLDAEGQFCDRGKSYRAAVFFASASEREKAEASKIFVEELLGEGVVIEIIKARPFYLAEDYHQDYSKKNPVRYKFYRWNCGRDQRLEMIWGGL